MCYLNSTVPRCFFNTEHVKSLVLYQSLSRKLMAMSSEYRMGISNA